MFWIFPWQREYGRLGLGFNVRMKTGQGGSCRAATTRPRISGRSGEGHDVTNGFGYSGVPLDAARLVAARQVLPDPKKKSAATSLIAAHRKLP